MFIRKAILINGTITCLNVQSPQI